VGFSVKARPERSAVVNAVLCVIDRSGSHAPLEPAGVEVRSLSTISDVVRQDGHSDSA